VSQRIRAKLTYANLVSTLCLFLLLSGGVAYAASRLGKNSVGTKQLKNNSVTGAKVKDGSLQTVDFGPGQIPVGATGSPGATGERGAVGPVGPTQGFAAQTLAGSAPPNAPEVGLFSAPETLKSAGPLFVLGRGEFNITCSSGTQAKVALYVDGVGVAASGEVIGLGTSHEVSLWGLSENLTAGSHTLTLSVTCTSGVLTGAISSGDGALGAILVGS
jgi:hypothetical protein